MDIDFACILSQLSDANDRAEELLKEKRYEDAREMFSKISIRYTDLAKQSMGKRRVLYQQQAASFLEKAKGVACKGEAQSHKDKGVSLADVVGVDEGKRQIKFWLAPINDAERFLAHGLSAGGGMLLVGPPGCGKTMLAKAVAGEVGADLVSITPADIFGRYVGESEANVKKIFSNIRQKHAVLFLDEAEGVLRPRGTDGTHEVTQRVDDLLLEELDGIAGQRISLIAATNMPWLIDHAFLRTGRIDRIVFVGYPSAKQRRQLIQRGFANIVYPVSQLGLDWLLDKTAGYSGADIIGVATKAKELAYERRLTRYDIPLLQEALAKTVIIRDPEYQVKMNNWLAQNNINESIA